MLKALYDYGIRNHLVLPAGYVAKPIKAYIAFSDSGEFLGIYHGDSEGIPCPDIGSLAQGKDKSNVLAEKRSVVIPPEATVKSTFFLNALRSAAQLEPMLNHCVTALESREISEQIREELDKAKVKPGDRISFRVNGKSILDSERILEWWQDYRQQFTAAASEPSTLCLITGEPAVPMTTTTPIQGLQVVGGHAKGDALICFDKTAFCSYDLKKAANAPVSEEAFGAVKAALDDLLKGAPILAGMKFVHWFDREISLEDDPLSNIFGLSLANEDDDGEDEEEEIPQINELSKRKQADAVPKSILSGEKFQSLDDASYFILLLSGVNGRIMIRRYDRGNYADLRKNISCWFDDLSLTNRSGNGTLKDQKLVVRLLRLLKYQKTDSRPFDRLSKELAGITPAILQAILTNGVLPDSIAAKALAYIRSKLLTNDEQSAQSPLPNALACQWLKVWLLRKNRMNHQEVPILKEYNMELDNAAYHCGGLMAVYAAIQKQAMPDVNTGIVERYYASAIQMPGLVIGQLSSRSNHHLEKMENKWLAEQYRLKLQEVSAVLGTRIPATLNLEQQSYFALGYYQMGAKLTQEKNERIANAKALHTEE